MFDTKAIFLLISAIIFSGIFFINEPAYGCSCSFQSPNEALKNADAVFMGKVIGFISDPSGSITGAEFDVQKSWKGNSENKVAVSSWANTSCYYEFSLNETYVVYANGKESLSTHLCSGTKLFADAYEDLRALGVGSIPVKTVNNEIPIDNEPCCEFTIPTIAIIASSAISIVVYLKIGKK